MTIKELQKEIKDILLKLEEKLKMIVISYDPYL